jgi:hypothetical protein
MLAEKGTNDSIELNRLFQHREMPRILDNYKRAVWNAIANYFGFRGRRDNIFFADNHQRRDCDALFKQATLLFLFFFFFF